MTAAAHPARHLCTAFSAQKPHRLTLAPYFLPFASPRPLPARLSLRSCTLSGLISRVPLVRFWKSLVVILPFIEFHATSVLILLSCFIVLRLGKVAARGRYSLQIMYGRGWAGHVLC